jgi:hypothetical protein
VPSAQVAHWRAPAVLLPRLNRPAVQLPGLNLPSRDGGLLAIVQRDLGYRNGAAALPAEQVQPTAALGQALGQPAKPAAIRIGTAYAVVGHLHAQTAGFTNRAEPDPGRSGAAVTGPC